MTPSALCLSLGLAVYAAALLWTAWTAWEHRRAPVERVPVAVRLYALDREN